MEMAHHNVMACEASTNAISNASLVAAFQVDRHKSAPPDGSILFHSSTEDISVIRHQSLPPLSFSYREELSNAG